MRIELRFLRSRPTRILLAAGLVGAVAAGCSRDASRYNDDPLGNPFQSSSSDVTSASPSSGQVESRPLPGPQQQHYGSNGQQPTYASSGPRSVPAAPAPNYASRPQNASYSPGATGSVSGNSGQPGWRWDGGTAITVQPGDTAESIGRRFGVPAQAVLQANNIPPGSRIQPGQRLVIPSYNAGASGGYAPAQANLQPTGQAARDTSHRPAAPSYTPAPASASGNVHVVNPGETLYSLGRRYGVSHSAIAQANGIHDQSQLSVGQRLTIPGSGSTRTAAASPPRQSQPQQRAATSASTPASSSDNNDNTRTASAPQPQQKAANVQPVEDEPETARSSLGSTPQFRWPVRGRIISGFGPKANGQQNDGINLAVPEGTEVKAAESGVVAYAGNELKGYGNLVLIRHADGWMTAYAHNSQLLVKRGDNVRRGQTIARAGQTGGVSSPQLHFEIRRGSTPVDPTQYLASL